MKYLDVMKKCAEYVKQHGEFPKTITLNPKDMKQIAEELELVFYGEQKINDCFVDGANSDSPRKTEWFKSAEVKAGEIVLA